MANNEIEPNKRDQNDELLKTPETPKTPKDVSNIKQQLNERRFKDRQNYNFWQSVELRVIALLEVKLLKIGLPHKERDRWLPSICFVWDDSAGEDGGYWIGPNVIRSDEPRIITKDAEKDKNRVLGEQGIGGYEFVVNWGFTNKQAEVITETPQAGHPDPNEHSQLQRAADHKWQVTFTHRGDAGTASEGQVTAGRIDEIENKFFFIPDDDSGRFEITPAHLKDQQISSTAVSVTFEKGLTGWVIHADPDLGIVVDGVPNNMKHKWISMDLLAEGVVTLREDDAYPRCRFCSQVMTCTVFSENQGTCDERGCLRRRFEPPRDLYWLWTEDGKDMLESMGLTKIIKGKGWFCIECEACCCPPCNRKNIRRNRNDPPEALRPSVRLGTVKHLHDKVLRRKQSVGRRLSNDEQETTRMAKKIDRYKSAAPDDTIDG